MMLFKYGTFPDARSPRVAQQLKTQGQHFIAVRSSKQKKQKKTRGETGHHVPSFTMFFKPQFPATHEMLLPNKQANQQNKLSTHVRAIGGTGFRQRRDQRQQRKQAAREEARLSAARLAVEVLHVIH